MLQELKYLGYLTGHRWNAVVISGKGGVSWREGVSCVALWD
jgi:hypothetical protein